MEDNFDYDYKEEINKIMTKRKQVFCFYDRKKNTVITDFPEEAVKDVDEYEQKLKNAINEKYKKEEQKKKYIEAINDVLDQIDHDNQKYDKIEDKWVPLNFYSFWLEYKIEKVLNMDKDYLVYI